MLSGAFRKQVAEKVDILNLSRKNSIPGSPIPETTSQSQVECILSRKGNDSLSPPTTSKNLLYGCHLINGELPKVSQIIKRANGERLTILTIPEKVIDIIVFDCQHTS